MSDTPPDPAAPDNSPNAEAARYRVAAREAEAARDAALAERDSERTRLQAWQRRDVVRIAGAKNQLVRGEDLLEVGGVDLATLVNDEGLVSDDAVTAALDTLRTERPYLFQQAFRLAPDPAQGAGQPLGSAPQSSQVGLGDVLAGRAVPARQLQR